MTQKVTPSEVAWWMFVIIVITPLTIAFLIDLWVPLGIATAAVIAWWGIAYAIAWGINTFHEKRRNGKQ